MKAKTINKLMAQGIINRIIVEYLGIIMGISSDTSSSMSTGYLQAYFQACVYRHISIVVKIVVIASPSASSVSMFGIVLPWM